jgi:hypothetical protein
VNSDVKFHGNTLHFAPVTRKHWKILPDEDIGGSGFAIADYKVSPELGGDEALKRLRERLHLRGLKLMLDFVPNHMGRITLDPGPSRVFYQRHDYRPAAIPRKLLRAYFPGREKL